MYELVGMMPHVFYCKERRTTMTGLNHDAILDTAIRIFTRRRANPQPQRTLSKVVAWPMVEKSGRICARHGFVLLRNVNGVLAPNGFSPFEC